MRPHRPCSCGGDRKRAKGASPLRNSQHIRQETRQERKMRLRAEAEARNAAWAALSVAEKRAALDARLGVEVGAHRQRTRLYRQEALSQ